MRFESSESVQSGSPKPPKRSSPDPLKIGEILSSSSSREEGEEGEEETEAPKKEPESLEPCPAKAVAAAAASSSSSREGEEGEGKGEGETGEEADEAVFEKITVFEALSQLGVVAALAPCEKLAPNPLRIITPGSVGERLWRKLESWWYKESGRDTTFKYLQNLYDQSFRHLRELKHKPEKAEETSDRKLRQGQADQLEAAIRDSKQIGITSLLATYNEDKAAVSRLKTLSGHIDLQLKALSS